MSAITACRPAAAPASTERRPAAARFAAPLRDTRGCKPRAPIELTLLQTGARDGSVVELLVDVRPHASAGALRWELLLPEGTQVLAGDLRGELAAGAAGTGPMAVHLRLPTTAEFPGVSLLAEARLVEPAAGAALTSPEERVAARQSLRWGLPPAAAPPADPARRLVDVARAAGARIAEVPAAHRSGR